MGKLPKSLSLKKAEQIIRRKGVRLMLLHSNRPGHPKEYYLIPGGYVTTAIAEELIRRPDVVQNHDGLLPDSPQSWQVLSL